MFPMKKCSGLNWVIGSVALCAWIFLLMGPGVWASGGENSGSQKSGSDVVMLPISALDVDQATAAISVLQEPQSPLMNLLQTCQGSLPDHVVVDGQNLSEEVKELCQMAEGFTRKNMDHPQQNFQSKGYRITVPLKRSHEQMQAVVWNTQNLDDAIAFVNLLQSGKLKGVKAYAASPWGKNSSKACTECPITELMFQVGSLKEQLEMLKKPKETDKG